MKKKFRIVTLVMLLLCLIPSALAQNFVPLSLDDDQTYAMNLFLSNFTEVGIDWVDARVSREELVDFAHDHMWFNDYESYEYGEYAGGNNCRVSDDRILEVINDYFYEADVDESILGQTRFDYDGEYYYHCETGGWNNSGFAYTVGAYPIGEDKYFVYFLNFCNGDSWENDVLDDDLDAIIERYGDPLAYGSATVHAKNLADRSTYKLISYTLV